jgi:hypothetical protein
MYIYVIDERVNDYWMQRTAELQPEPKEIIVVNRVMGMRQICESVRNHVQDNGIWILYIVGHGRTFEEPSRVELGRDNLTADTAFHFQQLRNLWTGEYPRIEVHSCYVASVTPPVCRELSFENLSDVPVIIRGRIGALRGTAVPRHRVCTPGTPGPDAPGHVIMRALANEAGVTVVAAVDPQYADHQFSMEGPRRYHRPAVYYRRDQ